jgi:hypothetical protein
MTAVNKPASDLYNISRMQIQFQEMSISSRMLWVNNSQAFLVGIYAGVNFFQTSDPGLHHKALMVGSVIPILGMLITIITLIDVISSMVQMNKLRQNYKNAHDGHEQEGALPLLNGAPADRFFQRISCVVSMVVFIAIWSYLIMGDHKWL